MSSGPGIDQGEARALGNPEISGSASVRQERPQVRSVPPFPRAVRTETGETPLDRPPTEKPETTGKGESKRSIWQILTGILLIAVGIPGLVLPVIPGIPMIAGGLVLILGSDHHLVQRAHKWLVDRGWLKPSDLKGNKHDG